MDERLSLKAVDDYSDDFSSKVTASFFSSKEFITGPEILKLCALPQVNLFVIRELLHAWKHEGQKLRSPYFDYNHPEVAESLTKFQNLLSNHISITKENFQPLLKKAVSRTLYLIVNPYDFFSDLLDNSRQTEELKNEIKYLKINKPPLERLVQRLEEKKQTEISGNEGFGLLDTILEEVNFTPEDPEEYLRLFSEIASLSLEKLYEQRQEIPVAAVPTLKPPVITAPPATPVVPKQMEIPVKTEPKKEVKQPQPVSSNGFGRIGRIKDHLTINQKFMFTKILFNGDFEIFTEAIDRLDTLDNIKQAYQYLEQNYPEWDRESEEYEEFIELVQKRFV